MGETPVFVLTGFPGAGRVDPCLDGFLAIELRRRRPLSSTSSAIAPWREEADAERTPRLA